MHRSALRRSGSTTTADTIRLISTNTNTNTNTSRVGGECLVFRDLCAILTSRTYIFFNHDLYTTVTLVLVFVLTFESVL